MIPISNFCKILICCFVVINVFACKEAGQAENDQTSSLNLDFEKYTLENGLDVVLHQDKSDPIVSVAILYHVGSNREKPGRTGFAHFFEHMLFQASENVGKGEFFKKINELGGEFNGGTWNDGTIYYEVVPKDALEKILWMEADRMGYFINTVTVPALENEKEVVKNEKRQRVDNNPYGHTNYVIDKAMFPSDHPYNWQVIGSLEDLQAATLDDVKEFYEKWYGPNNATMVIAGDFDSAKVKDWVNKYFAEIPAKEEVEPILPRPGKLEQIKNFVHEDNFANLPELSLVYPTVQDGHKDAYALDYLGQLLSDGKRAPLYKEIVENQKLAPETSSFNRSQEIAGKFYFKVKANDGVDLDSVQAALFMALDAFEKNGIDDKDMERIKNTLETDFYNEISSVLGKSFQLASYNEFRGDPGEAMKEVERILAVTKEDVMAVYQKYIKGKNYIATSFVPKGQLELALTGAEKAAVVEEKIVAGAEKPALEESDDLSGIEKTPSKIDRTIEPELGEKPKQAPLNIFTNTLSNGIKVYGVQNNELPLASFSLRIKGGLLMDDPAKIGVANLITDMMMEGTKNKTPEQLEDAIGQLGANLSMSTSPEYITLSGNCLTRNYPKVMALVEEILLEPRWDAKEFERVKESTINSIQQQDVQPNIVARNVSSKLLYGKDHILSQNTLGSIASVKSISLDDLKAYYEKNFSPSLASFHMAGGISERAVQKSLEGLNEKWVKKDVALPNIDMPAAPDKPVLYFVDIPGSKQSIIRIGTPAMKGNDADYFAANVVNNRLGVGSSGRLFQTLREEKGYTYGAYSFFPRRINQSYFGAASSVRSNVTLESMEAFLDIFRKYKDTYTAEDLEKTQNSMLKSNSREFETLCNKLGVLQNISTYDLPIDYVTKEEEVITSMTLDRAKALIGQYINPEKMIYLVIGDAKTQLEGLKKAGLGDPILIDRDGVPINAAAKN